MDEIKSLELNSTNQENQVNNEISEINRREEFLNQLKALKKSKSPLKVYGEKYKKNRKRKVKAAKNSRKVNRKK